MGNCQAIDNASLVIQHPSGRVDKLYCPVTACEIMKMNPGHYVALLLATTLYSSTTTTNDKNMTTTTPAATTNNPVRITRIKLLRQTDTLVLGHAYRLITTEEVMKGLGEKKYAKMKNKQSDSADKPERMKEKEAGSHFETARRSTDRDKIHQVKKHERNRARTSPSGNSATAKLRPWQPALKSISEAGS
ncbi:unnamed protein product [Ilex paraguariensis]|uniref:Uncharacterized protein n=1 Tax=Ilex paraguariensis TaxID=185542 RepID=A0ABC8R0W7_9AQUA